MCVCVCDYLHAMHTCAMQMSIGTLKHGLRGLFKTGKGGRTKSVSTAGKPDVETSVGHSQSHDDTMDTADADSDTSSLGEYDLVGRVGVWCGGSENSCLYLLNSLDAS